MTCGNSNGVPRGMIIGGLKNLNSHHPTDMQLVLLIVVVSLVAISVIAVATIRIRLKNSTKELSRKVKPT